MEELFGSDAQEAAAEAEALRLYAQKYPHAEPLAPLVSEGPRVHDGLELPVQVWEILCDCCGPEVVAEAYVVVDADAQVVRSRMEWRS